MLYGTNKAGEAVGSYGSKLLCSEFCVLRSVFSNSISPATADPAAQTATGPAESATDSATCSPTTARTANTSAGSTASTRATAESTARETSAAKSTIGAPASQAAAARLTTTQAATESARSTTSATGSTSSTRGSRIHELPLLILIAIVVELDRGTFVGRSDSGQPARHPAADGAIRSLARRRQQVVDHRHRGIRRIRSSGIAEALARRLRLRELLPRELIQQLLRLPVAVLDVERLSIAIRAIWIGALLEAAWRLLPWKLLARKLRLESILILPIPVLTVLVVLIVQLHAWRGRLTRELLTRELRLESIRILRIPVLPILVVQLHAGRRRLTRELLTRELRLESRPARADLSIAVLPILVIQLDAGRRLLTRELLPRKLRLESVLPVLVTVIKPVVPVIVPDVIPKVVPNDLAGRRHHAGLAEAGLTGPAYAIRSDAILSKTVYPLRSLPEGTGIGRRAIAGTSRHRAIHLRRLILRVRGLLLRTVVVAVAPVVGRRRSLHQRIGQLRAIGMHQPPLVLAGERIDVAPAQVALAVGVFQRIQVLRIAVVVAHVQLNRALVLLAAVNQELLAFALGLKCHARHLPVQHQRDDRRHQKDHQQGVAALGLLSAG